MTSGAVALLLQKYPDATPDQIKQALLASASPVKPAKGLDPGSIGHGELNLVAAESKPLPSAPKPAPAPQLAGGMIPGGGSLDAARGGVYVQDADGNPLTGEMDIFGDAWTPASWTQAVANQSSWGADGSWNGAVWTGTGFDASLTSAGTTAWNSHSWRTTIWLSHSWRGQNWASHCWRSHSWRDAGWDGSGWADDAWLGADWADAAWSDDGWQSASWS